MQAPNNPRPLANKDDQQFIALIEQLCSEKQKRYLAISRNYFIRMREEIDHLFRNHLRTQPEVNVLEVGPFLPYTLALKQTMEEKYQIPVSLDVIDMPLDPGKPLPESFARALHEYIAGNIEKDDFSIYHGRYHLALFTSVLEHLIINPYRAVCQIYNLLARGGYVFMSVPNALTLVNLVKWLKRENFHDQYARESPYGRHNREYTAWEMRQLLEHLHMVPASTKHVRFEPMEVRSPVRTMIFDLLFYLWPSLGTDIFTLGRKDIHVPPPETPPAWLYRDTPGLMSTFR